MMNKYKKIPDEVIDLHRKTTSEARVILNELLKQFAGKHLRIIVGKGTHGARGPVLRNFVKTFLNTHSVRFSQSKITDGGEGALEVFF